MRIGEVIEASTLKFAAQCSLHQPPPLGSLVKAGEGETDIFGVVYDVATSAIEPGRRPIALGHEEEDEAAIYRSQERDAYCS